MYTRLLLWWMFNYIIQLRFLQPSIIPIVYFTITYAA